VVTIEEGSLAGGFGSAVLELLTDHGVEARVRRAGVPDHFIEHGSRAECLAAAGLTAEGIAAETASWMRAPSRV
jgi:1-deoxy-D-xylulose-5-phosphate synthase